MTDPIRPDATREFWHDAAEAEGYAIALLSIIVLSILAAFCVGLGIGYIVWGMPR